MRKAPPQPWKVYEFGPFRLDLRDRPLLNNGEPVALTPKAFEVLVLLIERRGLLIQKDELMREVWAGSFVEEANLARTVWMLRRSLGDDRSGGGFIQTVPKHGYRFVAKVTESGDDTLPRTSIRSLAILPLKDSSGDPALEYLADGVTEGLIANLSRTKELRVIAAKSVMSFKGDTQTPQEIAARLNVDAIVAGDFSRNGDDVRVNLRLICGITGEELWSESYARNWAGMLYLEADAASDIAEFIRVELLPPQNTSREVQPDAYDLFLRGRYRLLKEDIGTTSEAIDILEQSVRLDRDFACAYAELARAYHLNAYFFAAEEKRWAEKAFIAAERANLLNPNLPEAHLARGLILLTNTNGFRHEQAIAEYHRAI